MLGVWPPPSLFTSVCCYSAALCVSMSLAVMKGGRGIVNVCNDLSRVRCAHEDVTGSEEYVQVLTHKL